jgi:signal transduction histidine kinase
MQIIALVLCFSAMILVANTLLIKPLYEASIEKTMVTAMEELREVDYLGEQAKWVDQILTIGGGKAFDITIDLNDRVIFSSSKEIGLKEPDGREVEFPDEEGMEGRPIFPPLEEAEWNELDHGVRIGHFIEPRNNNELYVCSLDLEDGIRINLTQPVEPILESIRQANILLLTGTLFFLLIASLIAFRIAKSFTLPIRKMQTYVEQLSGLNFSGKVELQTGDELEELSRDINGLSDALEEALASLEEKNEQLAKGIRSQKRLISDASHELRTPLTLIQGYADEIAAGYVPNREKQGEYVGYIAEESRKMKRLINEILELSRLESGRMTLNLESANVREAIESFFYKYEGFVEDQALQVQLDVFDAYCQIDSIRFEQILANFLSNAVKYGDENRKLRVWMQDVGERIRIHVYNSGQPIDESIMGDLWKGFYKADQARASSQSTLMNKIETGEKPPQSEDSFGLGLSIVKAIQDVAGLKCGLANMEKGVDFWFEVKKG